MIKLIKNIDGLILDNFEGSAKLFTGLEGYFDDGDYIKLSAFEAYLQDFSKAIDVTDLPANNFFGLKHNRDVVTIEC
jgi:hypothetical protein